MTEYPVSSRETTVPPRGGSVVFCFLGKNDRILPLEDTYQATKTTGIYYPYVAIILHCVIFSRGGDDLDIIIHGIYVDDIVQQLSAICVSHNGHPESYVWILRTKRCRYGDDLPDVLATMAGLLGRNGRLIVLDTANVRKLSRLWRRIRHNRPPRMRTMLEMGVAVPDGIANCDDASQVVHTIYWYLRARHII